RESHAQLQLAGARTRRNGLRALARNTTAWPRSREHALRGCRVRVARDHAKACWKRSDAIALRVALHVVHRHVDRMDLNAVLVETRHPVTGSVRWYVTCRRASNDRGHCRKRIDACVAGEVMHVTHARLARIDDRIVGQAVTELAR